MQINLFLIPYGGKQDILVLSMKSNVFQQQLLDTDCKFDKGNNYVIVFQHCVPSAEHRA